MPLPTEEFDQQIEAAVTALLKVRQTVHTFRWLLESGCSLSEDEMDKLIAEQLGLIPEALSPFSSKDSIATATGVTPVDVVLKG